MTEEEKIKQIDNKLDMTEDELITTNLLCQKIDLLESIIESQKYIMQERDAELSDLKDSRCLVKRYFKLKDENKRKDKIINKMANQIKDKR